MTQSLIEFAPVAFVGPNVGELPVVNRLDPIVASGSLMLTEVAHPIGAWPAGVPTLSSNPMPNIVEENAVALAGAGDHRAILALRRDVGSTFPSGGKGVLERSTKGGVHVVVSPTVAQSVTLDFVNVSMPSLKPYIRANKTHDFYMSVWYRITKRAKDAGGVMRLTLSTDGTWGLYGQQFGSDVNQQSQTGTSTGGTKLGENIQTVASPGTGPVRQAVAGRVVSTFDTDADTDSLIKGWKNAALWVGAARQSDQLGEHGSAVFYRAYFEDLTVSGRTFADVNTIDQDLYVKHVLTAGGRYHDDTTPTDPTTVV